MQYGSQAYYASRLGRVEDAGGGNVRLVFVERKGEVEEPVLDVIMPASALDDVATMVVTETHFPGELCWVCFPDGTCESAGPRWQSYFGLTRDEVRGEGWAKVIHPDDAADMLSKWEESLRTGNPYEARARFRCWDGKYRWVSCRATALRDRNGTILRWNGTTNITSSTVALPTQVVLPAAPGLQ